MKPSYAALRIPLAQRSRTGRTTTLWGQVRPGTGARRYRLEQLRNGSWHAVVGTASTTAAGYFTRVVRGAPAPSSGWSSAATGHEPRARVTTSSFDVAAVPYACPQPVALPRPAATGVISAVLLAAAVGLAAQATAGRQEAAVKRVPPPFLTFTVFSQTGLPLSDITWTGDRFLYATETDGKFSVSGPTGSPLTPFATIPSEIEEVRCRPSPGAHGWPAGFVYCHAPHGVVYRLAPDGTTTVFATLPENDKQDGVIVFDTAGDYGYAMLVTTGGPHGDGGTVYALGAGREPARVGTFPGPGGADNLELAPAQFGTASNQLLIAIDYDTAAARARAACSR